MPDTSRTKAALQALLADNTSGDISPQDVRDVLVSLFPQTTQGDLIALNGSGIPARVALGADHRFLGSDGSDAVYRNVGWDAILTPSGTNDHTQINTAITNGAKQILLLAGTHDIGGDIDVTGQSRVRLVGQGEQTILDFNSADRQIKVPVAPFTLASLKCLDSTAQDGTVDFDSAGSAPALLLIDDVHFRACEQAVALTGTSNAITKIIRNCRISNPRTVAATPISYAINANNVWIQGGYFDGAGGGANFINIVGGTPIFLQGISCRIEGAAFALRLQTASTITCFLTASGILLASNDSLGIDHDTGRLYVSDTDFDAQHSTGTGTVIDLASSATARISGGHIDGGGIGINCASAGNRITGVEIRRTTGDGINLAASGNMVNGGNNIHDASGGYGIHVASGTKNIVDGNRVVSNSSGQIQDDGTDTMIGLNNTTA